jgi:hypothetical protein
MMPRTGTAGTNGVLNARGRFGSRFLRIRMPRHTSTNAKSVPMLVRIHHLVDAREHRVTPTSTP